VDSAQQTEHVLPRLLTVEQASTYLSIPVSTLNSWRLRSKGPPFVRVNKANPKTGEVPRGNVIRYPRERLDAWINANVEVPE
jgi:hypothetical protein